MGAIRDFLRGVGILSSAGTTVSNAGIRLLNLRNQLNSLGKGKSTPIAREQDETGVASYAREAVGAVQGRRSAPEAGSESALERKRRLARESMRRLRAKRKSALKRHVKRRLWDKSQRGMTLKA